MALPPPPQGSLPAGWLAFAGRELNPLDRDERFLSTPEQKCIGLPEQKYISGAGKKVFELGAVVRLGSDYPPACPSWYGVSGACSD